MPFTLSEDEALLRKTVRDFARGRIGLERAAEQDRFDRFPAEPLAEAAGLGLMGLASPDNPLGATALVLAVDEVAQVDPNSAAALAVHNAAVAAVAAAASAPPELAARLAAGELAAWLVAEEATGSDTAHPGTLAVPHGGGYAVTGQKVWGVNAAAARHLLVLADVPGTGPTLLHLPADADGVSLGANESLLGLRAAGIRTVYLSGVKVPSSAVVGSVGQGLQAAARAHVWLRLGAAAALCGCVAGGLEAAARFAQTRIQFGQPVGTYQAVSDGLVAIDTQLAAARALTLQAAARCDLPDALAWAARAKAFSSEMALAMTRQAIRVQGGTGFMREGGTERFARDARALQFLGETVQMQREAIKRAVMPDLAWPDG